MKLKKILGTMMLAVGSTVILSSCAKEDNITYKKEKVEFVNLASDYYTLEHDYIDTYYVGDSNIKYADLGGFIKSLDGFYDAKVFKKLVSGFRNLYSVYVYANVGGRIKFIGCTVDWQNNTITISDPIFFNIIKQNSSIDFSAHLKDIGSETEGNTKITYNLSDYGFDIFYKDGKCLIPVSILNTIFCSNSYFNIYNDGEKYYGVYYDLTALPQDTRLDLKTCSLNTKEQTEELRLETYNQLRFVIDYFYGLKELKGIDSKDLEPYKDRFLSLDPEENKQAYYDYFVPHLNELHTRIGSYSFYAGTSFDTGNWNLDTAGEARVNYRQVQNTLEPMAQEFYSGSANEAVKISGETALLYFSTFQTGSNEELSREDAYKYDTYAFMQYAMDQIKDKNIKNVVVDMSLNGGGNVGALFRALGFLSNDPIDVYQKNFANGTTNLSKLTVDTNGDNKYDENDGYEEYNWYVLASLNTFSAANSFTARAKALGAKVIGQKTGGGMCSVLPIVLADTTTIEISSNNAEIIKIGDDFQYIENGITPDIEIPYSKFYDMEYLDSVIKGK